MSELDSETKAIGAIAAIVTGLDDGQRRRVLRYIAERFDIAVVRSTEKTTSNAAAAGDPPETNADFSDFASLYDACSPNTDSLRALVAGYWLQVCQSSTNFDGQSANRELKHLGHAISNITTALTALMSQKPALVLQLKKSGNTKQARKSYKVTESGIRKVKAMLSENGDAE